MVTWVLLDGDGYLLSAAAAPYFAIYLRENGYSVSQRNIIPGCANLVSVLTDFTWSFMSDYMQNCVYWMVGPILDSLATFRRCSRSRFFAASGYATGIMWTWANEINVRNAEERAITISSMNGFFYATTLFMPTLIFPQTMAPKFERGFPTVLSFAVGACGLILFANFSHQQQLRMEAEATASEVPAEVPESDVDETEKKA
ncbi:hypothetical protein FPSE_00548 [Fusarium pseudograminearum CS3096]|uniref:Pantothenate transporter liz1 n=1 Tax=Fusarium pseudograminearum (strain CS3096) TaxID=1028729 RepID=K3VTR7_FUSPC|nr:hypothetical protein FPSE_00548 [Fusarium pseudograminearum CS3096]EKJ79237.1 hypothetical protein FPSE_00548 [Fusarium pseudograminearum CS3096]